jgi:hypothetical protein
MTLMEVDLQGFYNHVVSVIRFTRTADQYGGQVQTPAVIASGIKCDIQPGVQTLRTTEEIGGQIESRLTYTLLLPPGTDIKIHDHVSVTSVSPNRDLVVAAVLAPESWDLELRAIATMEGEPLV